MTQENNVRFRALAAMTLDGKIARDERHPSDWTSPEDKRFFYERLEESDVVIVGRTTYEAAKVPLAKRNCIVFTRTVQEPEIKSEQCVFLNPGHTDIVVWCEERGYALADVLGGAQIYSWFVNERLLQELYLTIEPVLFGEGIPLFLPIATPFQMEARAAQSLNNRGTVLIHYQFHYSE